MFSSHPMPKAKERWMSNEDISDVLTLAREFADLNYTVSINLIGGEPTKDLDQFARIIDCLDTRSGNDFRFEMTTNGWWLRSWETLCRFAWIVVPFMRSHGLSIRISNDEYHDPFRSYTEKQIITTKEFNWADYTARRSSSDKLQNALEFRYETWEPAAEVHCPSCDAVLASQHCDKCGEDISDDDYNETRDRAYDILGSGQISELAESCKDGSLFVETRLSGSQRVSPVGRALHNGIGYQGTNCWGSTESSPVFTIDPGGIIQGICKVGGHVPAGHVKDGAWQLYAMAYAYIMARYDAYPKQTRLSDEDPERCRTCATFASKWLLSSKPKLLDLIQEMQPQPTESYV